MRRIFLHKTVTDAPTPTSSSHTPRYLPRWLPTLLIHYPLSIPRQFGKPLYSTRIILGDLNPCYEETAALLVNQDEIKSDEDLSAMLWDSDQRSAECVYHANCTCHLLLMMLHQ